MPHDPRIAERLPVLYALRVALEQFALERPRGLAHVKRLIKRGFQPETFKAVECGVYQGRCLVASAELLRDTGVPFAYFGLDTYTGFPELSETDRDMAPESALYRSEHLFADTSLEGVRRLVSEHGLDRSVHLVPGLFSETLSTLPDGPYHFVNIDCDIYEPHLECLAHFYPRMARGGVVFFDDYHSVEYPMARAAIDAFMEGKPERLFHLRYGAEKNNATKTFFVKF